MNMSKKNLRRLLLTAAILGLAALGGLTPSVYAQEINAFLGNTKSSGPWSLRSSTFWGGSFEYPLWYDIGIEQRVGYLTNFPEPSSVNTKTGSLLMDTNINLNLPFHFLGLVPYVTAGFGFMHALRNDPNNIGTNLDFNYGGGLKYLFPATPFGVRLDIRGHRFRHIVNKDSVNTFEYTIGMLYRLRKG